MSAQGSSTDNALTVDPTRAGYADSTGIYVRAIDDEHKWDAHDIAVLDRASLHRWLRSRGGENQWAENVVLLLLGHRQITEDEK